MMNPVRLQDNASNFFKRHKVGTELQDVLQPIYVKWSLTG